MSRRADGEEFLARILRSGISTFVSLNAELPAQAAMPARGVDGFLPYKATADLLAASARFSLLLSSGLCECSGALQVRSLFARLSIAVQLCAGFCWHFHSCLDVNLTSGYAWQLVCG